MCALPRVTAVTTEYQLDSSSKPSIVRRLRGPPTDTCVAEKMSEEEPGLQGFAPYGPRLSAPLDPALIL